MASRAVCRVENAVIRWCFRAGACAVVAMHTSAVIAGGVPLLRDVIDVGGRPYLRTVIRPLLSAAGDDDRSVYVRDGVCAYIAFAGHAPVQDDALLLRHFGPDMQPLHDDALVAVDPPNVYSAARGSGGTYVVWMPTAGYWQVMLSGIDVTGSPIIDPPATVAVMPEGFQAGYTSVAVGESGTFVAFGIRNVEGNTRQELHGRWLALNGGFLTPQFPVSTLAPHMSEGVYDSHVLGSGNALVLGSQGTRTWDSMRAWVKLLSPTGSVIRTVDLDSLPSEGGAILQRSGGLSVVYMRITSGYQRVATILRKLDFELNTVGPDVELPLQTGFWTSAPDGRIALAGVPNGALDIRVRLFDADGNAVSDWIDPAGPALAPPRKSQWGLTTQGVAYDADGTVWVAFESTEGGIRSYLSQLRPLPPGDLDGDGRLTNFDIDPFVLALTNREAYQAAFPHIPPEAIDILGDMNGDGVLTNFDIDPFVDALVIGP